MNSAVRVLKLSLIETRNYNDAILSHRCKVVKSKRECLTTIKSCHGTWQLTQEKYECNNRHGSCCKKEKMKLIFRNVIGQGRGWVRS